MLIKYAGSFAGDSWSSVQCDYTLPVELRPPIEVNAMVCVSNGQVSRMLVVCPLETHTIALTSTGGRSSAGSTYSHCTESQLPLPILPEYLTSIIMPVRMTVKPFALYRVTES